jgi:hypothetical protein
MSYRRVAAIALAAMAVLGLTSCAEEPMPEPTITADEAATRVEQHIRDVTAALPGARLEVQEASSISPCTAPNDRGPLGRVYASRSYWVRDIPQERNPETFDTALNHWTSNSYTVLVDARPQRAFVRVEAPAPDFTTLTLRSSVDGQGILSIVASSPCLLPDGNPAPKQR